MAKKAARAKVAAAQAEPKETVEELPEEEETDDQFHDEAELGDANYWVDDEEEEDDAESEGDEEPEPEPEPEPFPAGSPLEEMYNEVLTFKADDELSIGIHNIVISDERDMLRILALLVEEHECVIAELAVAGLNTLAEKAEKDGKKLVCKALVKILSRDPDARVRLGTLQLITAAKYPPKATMKIIITELESNEFEEVRLEALRLVTESKLGLKRLVKVLLGVISDREIDIRITALRALEDLGGIPEAPRILELICDSEEAAVVKVEACKVLLGCLEDHSFANPKDVLDMLNELVPMFDETWELMQDADTDEEKLIVLNYVAGLQKIVHCLGRHVTDGVDELFALEEEASAEETAS